MIKLLGFLFTLSAVNAFATPLKFECNSMSIRSDGHYLQGKSNVGSIEDYKKTAFAIDVFKAPHDVAQLIVKLENNECQFGEIFTIKDCSKVTVAVKPSSQFEVSSMNLTTFPQRDTFRSEKSNVTQIDVYENGFHPINSGVVTYETKVKMANFDTDTLTVRFFCIFTR